ncbi:MAG: hypothetical protein Q9222_004904 [Ikaeria aurantiellina]
MALLASFVSLALFYSNLIFAHNFPVGATVQTSSGAIIGHTATNRTRVSEYLGVPYARPPVGNLRFAAPQPFSSSSVFNASSYVSLKKPAEPLLFTVFQNHALDVFLLKLKYSDCPDIGLKAPPIKFPNQTAQFSHIINSFGGGTGSPQSEDCLTLNIWTRNPYSEQKKGVLLWIHGGRFTVGNTNTPFYQGQYLVDAQDIIFVSINYRLNIFGFSGAPGESQNVGLLDLRKAVEWVHDNVAGFGGDPTKITIMGQSAGGAAVDYYAYAYKDDPIVAGLISHSGTALSFTPNTPQFSHDSFLSAAAMLGCTGPESLACVRNQDFAAVLNVSAKVKPLPSLALAQPVFHPIVDNITVFGNYTALSAAGAFAKIPYLAGNTDKEDGFYRISAAGQNVTLTEQQWLLFDLEGFTCPTAIETSARVDAGVPTWRYRYFGDWPNLRLYPGSGSYHGSDLHMIFGGIEDIVGPNLPNTVPEERTMAYMMHAWATFVKNPASGLSKKLHWPQYNASRDTLVQLGYMHNPGSTFVSPGVYDAACPKNGSTAEAQGAF